MWGNPKGRPCQLTSTRELSDPPNHKKRGYIIRFLQSHPSTPQILKMLSPRLPPEAVVFTILNNFSIYFYFPVSAVAFPLHPRASYLSLPRNPTPSVASQIKGGTALYLLYTKVSTQFPCESMLYAGPHTCADGSVCPSASFTNP